MKQAEHCVGIQIVQGGPCVGIQRMQTKCYLGTDVAQACRSQAFQSGAGWVPPQSSNNTGWHASEIPLVQAGSCQRDKVADATPYLARQ